MFSHKESCPQCGSKDNVAVHTDGYKKCFTPQCGYYEYGNSDNKSMRKNISKTISDMEVVDIRARGLTARSCEKYGYSRGTYGNDPAHIMEYRDITDSSVTRYKIRTPDLKGQWTGKKITPQLYGQHVFQEGGKWLIITEGEIDAISAYQMFDSKYAAVSIPNGLQAALHDVKNNFKFVNSFEKVVICFDNEPDAQRKAQEVATIFPLDRKSVV